MNPPDPSHPLRLQGETRPDKALAGSPDINPETLPGGTSPLPSPQETSNGVEESFEVTLPATAAAQAPRARWSLNAILIHPVITGGMAATGVCLLAWSLLFRLPGANDVMPVYASAMVTSPKINPTKTALTPEAIQMLREEVAGARSYLVQSGTDLVQTISTIERLALQAGWRAEVALKPAQPSPAGLDRTLLHSAEIFLTNLEGNSPDNPAYERLLAYFRQVKALGKKLECTDINLQAGPDGLNTVQVNLVIWTQLSDDQPAPR